jgi:hypothetical protein
MADELYVVSRFPHGHFALGNILEFHNRATIKWVSRSVWSASERAFASWRRSAMFVSSASLIADEHLKSGSGRPFLTVAAD